MSAIPYTDVISSDQIFQRSKAVSSFPHPARSRMSIPQVGQASLTIRALSGLSGLGDGLLIHSFLPVSHRKEAVDARAGVEPVPSVGIRRIGVELNRTLEPALRPTQSQSE